MAADKSRKLFLKRVKAGEKQIAKALDGYFSDQTNRIVKAVADFTSPTPAIVPKILKVADEHTALMKVLAEPLLTFMAQGAIDGINEQPRKPRKRKQVESDFLADFDLPDRMKEIISATFDDLEGRDYWKAIQDTTAESITAILKQTIEDGLSVKGIAKQLRESLGTMGRVRSELIARTETSAAFNSGHNDSYLYLAENELIQGKEWLAIADDDARQTHLDANGKQVGPSEDFNIGGHAAKYPGDPSLPAEERCNCRCSTAGVFKE